MRPTLPVCCALLLAAACSSAPEDTTASSSDELSVVPDTPGGTTRPSNDGDALTLASGLGDPAEPADATDDPASLEDEAWDGVDDAAPLSASKNRSCNPPGDIGGLPQEGIHYYGGAVMSAHTNLYYVWYGDLSSRTQQILHEFGSHLGGSRYFNVVTTYRDYDSSTKATHRVHDALTLAGETHDDYSRGRDLNDGDIAAIVSGALKGGRLPTDPDGVYMVMLARDVNISGLCSAYCGWHTWGTLHGKPIKYGVIGNPLYCPDHHFKGGCFVQPTTSPNDDPPADGMVNVLAHEIAETVTDPHIDAWYDCVKETVTENGKKKVVDVWNEVGDKCAWDFGSTFATPNGSRANVTLHGHPYLLQRLWLDADRGACRKQY